MVFDFLIGRFPKTVGPLGSWLNAIVFKNFPERFSKMILEVICMNFSIGGQNRAQEIGDWTSVGGA
jgi:hypothetical protein